MAQAAAYLSGRDYVIPRDVQIVFHDVIGHRIVLSPQAKMGDVTAAALLKKSSTASMRPRLNEVGLCCDAVSFT